jgi:hypothetical protein
MMTFLDGNDARQGISHAPADMRQARNEQE